jgi:hypothetical protein
MILLLLISVANVEDTGLVNRPRTYNGSAAKNKLSSKRLACESEDVSPVPDVANDENE